MSALADHIGKLLGELMPLIPIKSEYFVVYKGQRLFVDYYIPSFLMAVEVHGRQHDVFVEHFHKDSGGWKDHKKRDSLKEEWALENDITYVVIRESDKIETKEDLLTFIEKV